MDDLVDDDELGGEETEGEKIVSVDIVEEATDELPADEYFKVFFAFALWGFIPPGGGDYFKSALMAAVVETDLKGKKR